MTTQKYYGLRATSPFQVASDRASERWRRALPFFPLNLLSRLLSRATCAWLLLISLKGPSSYRVAMQVENLLTVSVIRTFLDCRPRGILGTLRNYDGDGNGNVKKAIGSMSKTTILHVSCITLFCTFLYRPCITRTWIEQFVSLLGNGIG